MSQSLLSFLSSSDQLDLYAHLPRACKDEAADWFAMISEIESITSIKSTTSISSILKHHAARLNKSVAQCTRKYYEWCNGTDLYPAGDWRLLVNRKKAGPSWYSSASADSAPLRDLPRQFLEHWRKLCGENQRGKCETQYRALLRQLDRWRKGDPSAAIPGYDAPPENDDSGHHPRGWSYRNLMRFKPLKVEFALVTQGTAAAIKLLPGIPGTRVGARFLEYIFFDDVWLDRKIIVPGYRDPLRLLQLGCLDYASAVYLHYGQRPETPVLRNQSTGFGSPSPSGEGRGEGHMERLKEAEMKLLVATLLEKFGFPAEYDMHLIVERGTATLREADARALFDLSGGRIKVCYTTMEGGLVLSWEERSSGNARGKGPLESWHNLLHNESAALTGQVGKDRDHSPAQLHGQERAAVALNTAAALLTPEQRSRLRLPFATKDQALYETAQVINRINSRTDHDLEGFDNVLLWRLKLGAVVDSPSPRGEGRGEGFGARHSTLATRHLEWRPESELALLDPALLDHLEYDTRRETPFERMARLSAGARFQKLPPGLIYGRFYEDSHVLKKLDAGAHTFEFIREGKTYRYSPSDSVTSCSIPSGEYLAYFNPSDMSRIHLTRDGRFISTWNIEQRVRRGDSVSLAQATARKQALLNTHLANVRRRHSDTIAQREADMRANEEVLSEAGLLPSDPSDPSYRSDRSDLDRANLSHREQTLNQTATALSQVSSAPSASLRESLQDVEVTDEMIRAGNQPDLDPDSY